MVRKYPVLCPYLYRFADIRIRKMLDIRNVTVLYGFTTVYGPFVLTSVRFLATFFKYKLTLSLVIFDGRYWSLRCSRKMFPLSNKTIKHIHEQTPINDAQINVYSKSIELMIIYFAFIKIFPISFIKKILTFVLED